MKRRLAVVLLLIAAICLGLAVRKWLVTTVRIAGSSMENTLCSGDVALVLRLHGEPKRGDVVQCAFSGRDGNYVKRVIGLPGEVIECLNGQLLVDGRAISEPYVSSPTEDFRAEPGADEYLVLGDNRAESYDSRADDMGCISAENLLGRVCWILWPLNRFGPVE